MMWQKERNFKVKESLRKIRICAAGALENLYLLLFGIIVLYLFLQKTTFDIPWNLFVYTEDGAIRTWSRWVMEPPYYLLGYTAVFRILIQKEYNWLRTAFAVGILYGGRYLWEQNISYKTILVTFLIVGAIGISFRKLVRVYCLLVSSALIITIVCAVSGLIENYVMMRGENMRMFFGINSPTNFASFVFFQILCWWYLRKEKLSYIEAGLTVVISVLLNVFCDTRTACVLLLATAMCMVWMRFRYKQAGKRGKEYRMCPLISSMGTLVYPLLAILSVGLTLIYTQDSELLTKINSWLSARLSLGKRAFDVYGVSWFGKYIRMFAFESGATVNNYFYIDSSYVQLPIMFGLAAMIFLLFAFLWISCRARAEKDWIFLLILVLAGVHCVTDCHLIEIQFCPFVLALLADTRERKGMTIKEIFGGRLWTRD